MRIRGSMMLLLVCMSLVVQTGCWDRRELNDRALWLASGIDAEEDGRILLSGQIIVPYNVMTPAATGGGGDSQKNYMVASETGVNLGDTLQKIQSKVAREVFFGQRQVLFLGEQLAKEGLEEVLDNATRQSESSIRTDVFVIKGDKAVNVLKMGGTLESIPVLGALKKHEQSGGRGETTFLDFLIAANREGIHPTLPAAELAKSKDMFPEEYFNIAGVAILDGDLKLAGYLNMEEDRALLWLLNKLRKMTAVAELEGGNASAEFINLRSNIKPIRNKDGSWHFHITLRGDGNLLENNTKIDANDKQGLSKLELAFEESMAGSVSDTIRKVQEEYGLDIFGFGLAIHRKFPREWPDVKDHWDDVFRRSTFTVKANLLLERAGLTGKPAI